MQELASGRHVGITEDWTDCRLPPSVRHQRVAKYWSVHWSTPPLPGLLKTISKHYQNILHTQLSTTNYVCMKIPTKDEVDVCPTYDFLYEWKEDTLDLVFLLQMNLSERFFYGLENRLTETSLKSNCRRNIKISSLFWQFQSELSSTGGPQLHVSRK